MINVNISIRGSNNRVSIEEGVYLKDVRVEVVGDDNTIKIGKGTFIVAGGALRIYSSDCLLTIGNKVHIGKADFHLAEPHTQIVLGNNCMIAEDVRLASTDGHSIVDCQTRQRLNLAGNIELEDDVWLAYGVQILKGVRIGKGSIVGSGSIVTKDIPANSLAVGIPAKVIKTGVTWDVDLIPHEYLNY